jgi:hypothetical protein
MSVFDMDEMEPALDKMVPALAAKVGIENEINDAQGAQTGEARSCIDSIHNLELGEEDNLAEVAQAKVLTEVTKQSTNGQPGSGH